MKDKERLKQIRENERDSHIEMYSNEKLYQEGSWLSKPIKTVLDILPEFEGCQELKGLDLGCGIGRNSISIAKQYQKILCSIDCIDILELAIEKLCANAKEHGVDSIINGIVKPIEAFQIQENWYDFILAVSALEHIDSKESFVGKLVEIRKGIRKNGIVCLVINSDVKEKDKITGKELQAQFEVNLPTKELQKILEQIFEGWLVMKSTVVEQQYDIPRKNGMSELKTKVVTYVIKRRYCNELCSK